VKRQPVFDANGAVVRIAGFTRDVTDRKERERGLERYETIVEALGDPIYAVDADGCYTFVNEAFVEETGYGREEILGRHVSTILPETDVERGRTIVQELLSTDDKQTTTWEMTRVTADGEQIPSENHLALLPPNENGEFRGTAGVVRDITDRKETEKELRRHNEQLEEFAGIVSHDLRNPLRVIEGRVELAQENCEREHLDAIESAADRMSRIIEDLLWLAREGRNIGALDSVVVQDAMADAWELVADDAGEATLQYADEAFATTTIKADIDRLAQLLENLLRNAIQHGGEDVTVTVGPLNEGFYIEDDGPGIPEDNLEKIFSAGYSTRENGVGFGLSIVKQVADAHNWEVNATERTDGGARFEITGMEVITE
jgi:PAS domain S-box-containing protein